MSLYSALDFPSSNHKPAAKPAGFIPLYADPDVVVDTEVVAQPIDESVKVQERPNAALQFAPTIKRRPPVTGKRKAGLVPQDVGANTAIISSGPNVPRLEVTNNFEDYADYQPEDNTLSQNGDTRRKMKKSKNRIPNMESLDWDDDYDPARPVEFADYLPSTEREHARIDWQEQKAKCGIVDPLPRNSSAPSRPSHEQDNNTQRRLNFGPPRSKLNFAPSLKSNVHVLKVPETPPEAGLSRAATGPGASVSPERRRLSPSSLQPPPLPTLPQDNTMPETAEEAYLRRVAMQQSGLTDLHSPRPALPPPPPPPVDSAIGTHIRNLALAGSSMLDPIVQAVVQPSPPPKTTYSAEPTYYSPQPSFESSDEAYTEPQVIEPEYCPPVNRGSAPGQKGFASRYMAAQGWSKGQGLGAAGSGRLAPLFVKPQKDGKKGKIIDRQKKSQQSGGPQMTRVVLLEGMITKGAPIDEFLQQDVGESCSNAYGNVERVKMVSDTGRVLVKFTDTISALRCVSTVEGRDFAGNRVSARYYPEEAFEQGIWTR